jgi:hypothetical protein
MPLRRLVVEGIGCLNETRQSCVRLDVSNVAVNGLIYPISATIVENFVFRSFPRLSSGNGLEGSK